MTGAEFHLMRILALALLLAVFSAGRAQAGDPSFDCARASTAVEKAICDEQNPGLASRDGALARLYDALKEEGGHEELRDGQKAWLRSRDACGAKLNCLERRYDERLAELAEAAGDEDQVTGGYRYRLTGEGVTPDSDRGDAFVVREADGTLTGHISTVSGRTFFVCEVDFNGAEPDETAWTYTGSEAQTDGSNCTLTVTLKSNAIEISSENCRDYCGANGYFDGTYKRVK